MRGRAPPTERRTAYRSAAGRPASPARPRRGLLSVAATSANQMHWLSCQRAIRPVILVFAMPAPDSTRFAGWLETSMRSRGLTQAQLARSVGVADTQVSRWRRGHVVPTVQYLQ